MGLRSLKTGRFLFLLTFFLTTTEGFSQDTWTQFGVRPLAMGNAFVGVADDFNALYYNPAGLARIKEWELEIINPKFDISANTYFLAKTLKKKGKMSLSDTFQTISDETGKPNYIGFSLTPYYIRPGWGFGLTSDTFASFIPHQDGVDIDTKAYTQLTTIPVSHARNFFANRLSLGATFKLIGTAGFDENVTMGNISLVVPKSQTGSNLKLKDFLVSGLGFGVDLGLLFTPSETPMEPTFGMSVINIGGIAYRKLLKSGTTAPNVAPIVNTGFSIKPYKTDRMYVLVALDTHMINKPSHFSHKLNLGVEWGFGKIIKVEAGLHEGYLTGGFQFDVWLFKLRLATYRVDRSPLVGMENSLTDRRVVLQFKLLI